MIIKLIWLKCESCNGKWTNDPVDSYWVECTREEAEDKVFPFIKDAQLKKAYQIEKDNYDKTKGMYFLVSKDLKSIQTFPWYYPYSGMWNGYCPFREINEIEVSNLKEISSTKYKFICNYQQH